MSLGLLWHPHQCQTSTPIVTIRIGHNSNGKGDARDLQGNLELVHSNGGVINNISLSKHLASDEKIGTWMH